MPFRTFFGKKNSLKRVRTFFVSKFVMKALKVFFYLGLVLNILGAIFYGIMFLLSILASIGSSVGFFTFLWENYSSAIMLFLGQAIALILVASSASDVTSATSRSVFVKLIIAGALCFGTIIPFYIIAGIIGLAIVGSQKQNVGSARQSTQNNGRKEKIYAPEFGARGGTYDDGYGARSAVDIDFSRTPRPSKTSKPQYNYDQADSDDRRDDRYEQKNSFDAFESRSDSGGRRQDGSTRYGTYENYVSRKKRDDHY